MAKAKRQSTKKTQARHLEESLVMNGLAISEGPRTKSWSQKDLKIVTPLTYNQEEAFREWFEGQNLCLFGSAGAGKSFLACFMALDAVLKRHQEKIIIVRSIVPSRDVGFLPGTRAEKAEPYELPYHDIFHELMGRKSTYEDMKKAAKVEFIETSFVRGLTWDNAVIIVDEFQNLTFHEINSIMTRVGNNSRVIVSGDILQTDLSGKGKEITGAERFLRVIQEMKAFSSIHFTVNDIVRSGFVKSWIMATEAVPK